jgi:hypothetical protein
MKSNTSHEVIRKAWNTAGLRVVKVSVLNHYEEENVTEWEILINPFAATMGTILLSLHDVWTNMHINNRCFFRSVYVSYRAHAKLWVVRMETILFDPTQEEY